jgi:SPP1 gp7 family putative phage head morphogenesis protein
MRGNQYGDPDPAGGFYWHRGWSPFFDPHQGQRGFGLLGRGAHVGWEAAKRAAMRARRAETQFARQLRHIARHVGAIVNGMFSTNPSVWPDIAEVLYAYGDALEPWAKAAAERQLAEVSRRDAKGWHELGQQISRGLHQEIANAPIPWSELMRNQVELIQSLPQQEAQLVQALSRQAMVAGTRWTTMVPTITERLLEHQELRPIPQAVEQAIATATERAARTGESELRLPEDVVLWMNDAGGRAVRRANLIARTETSRAASVFQATRAKHVGSEGFIWRTARDRDVRELHRLLEGHYFHWNDPPILDDGRPGLPGTIWNCRCFAEIILPHGDIISRLGPQPRNPAFVQALAAQGYGAPTG